MNRTRTAALAITVLALAGGLAGCGGGPSESACKAAMTRDYRYALAHPDASPAARPAACKGLPDATVRKFAAEIMAGG
jgi:hypothetical protein